MTFFAAITTKNNNLVIVGMANSKSAASRAANRAVQDAYGNRSAAFGEVHLIEFDGIKDAQDYIEAANRGK